MLRKLLLCVALTLPFAATLPSARAADLSALSRQYSDDMFEAVQSIAVAPNFTSIQRVQRVVDRLGAVLGKGKWTLVIFQEAKMPKDMDVSAFALPGNRIAVSDWEASVASDDALGFTIGHEIGHVELGHQNQTWAAIIQQTGVQPKSWTDLASHAQGVTGLARQQEFAADKFGFNLANKAGFDAAAGARELLGRLGEDALHPAPAARLTALGLTP